MMTTTRAFSALLLLCAIAMLPLAANAAIPAMQAASQQIMKKALATAKPEAAKFLLEQAIVADPANATAFTALGELYSKMKEPALSMKYYEIALTIDPINVKALAGAAYLNIAKGKTDEANANLVILKKACPTCGETSELEAALSHPNQRDLKTKHD